MESAQGGTDLNGDGDATDFVVHVFNASNRQTTNLGLAATSGSLQGDGQLLGFRVRETEQGNTDLNGDGDTNDDVLHVFRQ